MLELDGFVCESAPLRQGHQIPLLVHKNGQGLAIGIQSGLLEPGWPEHSVRRLMATGAIQGMILNDFVLRRNLPDEHHLIRDIFERSD